MELVATTKVGGAQVVSVAMFIGGILLLFPLFKDYNADFEIIFYKTVRVKCTKK